MPSSSGNKLATGIAGLDSILDGGFSEGRVILVLGEPGTGKTILCSQYLYFGATQKNEKGLFIGMNEPKPKFATEMAALGMDFERLEKTGTFSYVDATEVKRIPEETK